MSKLNQRGLNQRSPARSGKVRPNNHIAQGNALWLRGISPNRPVRAKAFCFNAFALTGRLWFFSSYFCSSCLLVILCFLLVFPFMGACCAQIKGFTLGWRELVLVRPNVKPFI